MDLRKAVDLQFVQLSFFSCYEDRSDDFRSLHVRGKREVNSAFKKVVYFPFTKLWPTQGMYGSSVII